MAYCNGNLEMGILNVGQKRCVNGVCVCERDMWIETHFKRDARGSARLIEKKELTGIMEPTGSNAP